VNISQDSDPERDPQHPVTASSWPGLEATTPTEVAVDPAVTAAFGAFYRRSAPRLVAFLRWQGASLPDAAECAQEALTLAFRGWLTIGNPHAWCRVVASRLYARRVADIEAPVEDPETAGTPLLPPGTDIDALEQRHDVLRLLAQLPARQRQVMAWTYDGATPTEIAEALRIRPDAVRGSLRKARTTLRQYLQDHGGEIR
jgi:RNA polymerase sigma factor (sigma-70 family)